MRAMARHVGSPERSPSLRGRGLKFGDFAYKVDACKVALFARAWIEIAVSFATSSGTFVALFARAWIEIVCRCQNGIFCLVALFARAWIERRLRKGRDQ